MIIQNITIYIFLFFIYFFPPWYIEIEVPTCISCLTDFQRQHQYYFGYLDNISKWIVYLYYFIYHRRLIKNCGNAYALLSGYMQITYNPSWLKLNLIYNLLTLSIIMLILCSFVVGERPVQTDRKRLVQIGERLQQTIGLLYQR